MRIRMRRVQLRRPRPSLREQRRRQADNIFAGLAGFLHLSVTRFPEFHFAIKGRQSNWVEDKQAFIKKGEGGKKKITQLSRVPHTGRHFNVLRFAVTIKTVTSFLMLGRNRRSLSSVEKDYKETINSVGSTGTVDLSHGTKFRVTFSHISLFWSWASLDFVRSIFAVSVWMVKTLSCMILHVWVYIRCKSSTSKNHDYLTNDEVSGKPSNVARSVAFWARIQTVTYVARNLVFPTLHNEPSARRVLQLPLRPDCCGELHKKKKINKISVLWTTFSLFLARCGGWRKYEPTPHCDLWGPSSIGRWCAGNPKWSTVAVSY
jgi:hypothetical protein